MVRLFSFLFNFMKSVRSNILVFSCVYHLSWAFSFANQLELQAVTKLLNKWYILRITKVITINPEGNKNVYSKEHLHTSSSGWIISQRTNNMLLEEKGTATVRIHPLGYVSVWNQIDGPDQHRRFCNFAASLANNSYTDWFWGETIIKGKNFWLQISSHEVKIDVHLTCRPAWCPTMANKSCRCLRVCNFLESSQNSWSPWIHKQTSCLLT